MERKSPETYYDPVATSNIPVVCITSSDLYHDNGSDDEVQNILPLPASKYRYSKWYQMDETEVTSDMLRCPRVRKAPTGFKAQSVWMLEEQERALQAEDDDAFFEHNRSRRNERNGWFKRNKKQDYSNKLEKWEVCECVNLSYQDLGHPYQMKEFLKVLRRLMRAETIELIDDSLSDLSSVVFPRVRYLFLQRNHLSNLKKLPRMAAIEHLSLQQNNIRDLRGLETLKSSRLKSLILRENPVSLLPGYRKRVFELLPNLQFLDELPCLPSDTDGVNKKTSWSLCPIF